MPSLTARSGLRFVAQGPPLEPGLRLDIAINWPVLLDDHVQLQLIVTGVVVRSKWNRGRTANPASRFQNAQCGTERRVTLRISRPTPTRNASASFTSMPSLILPSVIVGTCQVALMTQLCRWR